MGSGSDSHHHHHRQYRHCHRKTSYGQEQDSNHNLPEVNPKLKLILQGKKNPRVTSQGKTEDNDEDQDAEMFEVFTGKRHVIGDEDVQDQVVATSNARICVDCKTSKTPLWRSGPHGPKSLCNACGIRHRKRRRREFEFLKMGNGISMKDKKKKNRQVVDEEKVLLLLQGKFAGQEEAEAAVLLMALSCGLCVR